LYSKQLGLFYVTKVRDNFRGFLIRTPLIIASLLPFFTACEDEEIRIIKQIETVIEVDTVYIPTPTPTQCVDTIWFNSRSFSVEPGHRSYEYEFYRSSCAVETGKFNVAFDVEHNGEAVQVQFLFYLNDVLVRSHGFYCIRQGQYNGTIDTQGDYNSVRVQVRNGFDYTVTASITGLAGEPE
jgi:hypothetical protein